MSDFLADVYATPPMRTNEIGVKFWLDVDLTNYAIRKGLDDVVVFFVQESNGKRARLITQRGQPVYENASMECVAVRIDIMALAKGSK